MCKIGRPVERIDDPLAVGKVGPGARYRSGLFGEDRMFRVTPVDGGNDEGFALLIRGRNEIRTALQLDKFFAAGVVLENFTGGASQLNCKFEVFHWPTGPAH